MFNPYNRYPVYPNEMHPSIPPSYPPTAIMGAEGQIEITGAESELDQLLAMSGAAAYGYSDDDDVYAGMEITGAEAYGAEAYGVDPRAVPQQFLARYRPMFMQKRPMPGRPAAPRPPIPPTARQVQVTTSPGTHVRRQSLGLATAAVVAAGGAAVATAQPQVPFRPEKMVVPSDIAGAFDITDIKVGKDSQFVAPGAVPARAFDEKAVDNVLSFHSAAISQIISVAVVNNGGVAQFFKCYMTGTSIE